MTTTKKIVLWIVFIFLFNIFAPLFYWLWTRHRRAFWISVVTLYLAGLALVGYVIYALHTGHHDHHVPDSVMTATADTAYADAAPFGMANGNTGSADDDEPAVKRDYVNVPTDIRELAEWLCVPYTEEDCVPRMGVTYKDTDCGYFKCRFYITGGKNGTDFGQAQWYIYLRTKGLVTLMLKSLGHSIYQLNSEDTGALDGWIFVDHDGERIFLIDAYDEWEYTIVDEELEADPDGSPQPAPKFRKD